MYGIQGSGKSTQGALISRHLKIPYLSTGQSFRELAKETTRQGRYIKETLAAGQLIPDDIAIPIVESYLSRSEYKKGWILDGFPRTLPQVRAFKTPIDVAFFLLVSDKEALWRLAFRKDEKGNVREDETIMALRKRIEWYNKEVKPVMEYYRKQNILVEINGERKVEEITKDLLSKIQWYEHGNGKRPNK